MAYAFFVKVVGNKQGAFKGESLKTKRADWIEGLEFGYEIVSPRDAATGQSAGKRQHKPCSIVKEWGPASPQLLQACATNEGLKSVDFEFTKVNPKDGQEYVYAKIKLEEATVSRVAQFTGEGEGEGQQGTRHTSESGLHEKERVFFTFMKITWSSVDGKTEWMDNWRDQGGA